MANWTKSATGGLRNTGWTDEARAASLAVRRARAAARRKAERDKMFTAQAEAGGDNFIEN